jgi:glutamine synthetase adenylyltransferase
LFGKSANDIDNFMIAAKRLTARKNPSETAMTMRALASYGQGGTALLGLLTGHPGVAGAFAGGMAASRAAAQLLFTPGLGRKILDSALPSTLAAQGAAAATGATGGVMPPPQP